MKQPIRFFSIGLLLASAIIAIVYLLEDSTTTTSNADDIDTDEMIHALEVEGFHVLSSSEYIKLTVDKDNQNNNNSEEDKDQNDSKNKDDKKDDNKNTKDKNKDETNNPKDSADNSKQKNDENNADEENSNNNDDEVITYTLSVKSNMLGPEISQLLEDNKIVDDAEAFNRYLELEGYAPYIQLGEHKVSSDMSHAELAKKIANQ